MTNQFSRTTLLFGNDAMEKLEKSRVAVFGIGGVGGYVVEAFVRSGVGTIDIIDNDKVCLSNLNRQIIATHKTIGRYKTEVMKERALDINPMVNIIEHRCFYLPKEAKSREEFENNEEFDFSIYDYIVDAIDTVSGKIDLIVQANKTNTPIISSMGAGNKINPEMLQVADINETKVCPLAKVMRKELKKRGIRRLKCVYSTERALTPKEDIINAEGRKRIPGSTAFVPSVAGLIIASEVIKDLTNVRNDIPVV